MSNAIRITGPYHLEPNSPERKGFVIASSIVLLIQLAGGHFEGGVTPFGGLKLDRPELLHLFIWLYLGFQALRYWQSIGHPSASYFSNAYARQIDAQMFRNPDYKKFLEHLISATEFTLGKDAPTHPLVHRPVFRRYLDFRRGWSHPGQPHPGEDKLPIFRVPLRKMAPMEIKAHLKVTFVERFWFDAVFPWVLAICAVLVGIFNYAI